MNNLVKVPILRGSSNTPEVLTARGRVHLSTPPLPRPKFTRSILDTFSSSPAPVPLPKPKALTTKRSVRLKSSTPPPRFAARSKLKLKSPPPPVKEKGFTDIDADGDTDQEEDGLRAFDSTHPFFNPIGSPTKNRPHASEVILVEDSDEESAEDAHDVDEEEDPTGEDIDKVLRMERWNTPKHAFALYLLRFMDPLGGPYDDVDASFFEKESVYDPFENDNDPIQPKKTRVEDVYEEDIGEDQDEDEEEDEQEEEENGTDEDEDADSEDAEVEGDGDEEQEIDEDDDNYEEETEIENNLTTQHPPTEFEYTPDLTTCGSPSSSLPPSSPGPGLGILSSPSLYSNSFANSSSHSLFSDSAYSDYGAHSDSIIILEEHYPNKKYTYTPAPPKKRKHRLRIKRLEKKLAKIKKSDFLCRNDEKPAKEEVEEEVDQLDESEEGAGDDGATKPVLKEGEVWDPFGDEPEI